MTLEHTPVTLVDGHVVSLYPNHRRCPPDYKGMACSSYSFWIKYEDNWYSTAYLCTRSRLTAISLLQAMTLAEVVLAFNKWEK